ncbi:MAG TPA: hypothetical protein VHA56_13310 [Mucilaginibacter sp.]|nr:hypothetical protein [Mucilaginibacter sp.]
MEPREKDLNKKMEDEKDDATKPFPNAQKESAAKINRGIDPKQRNLLGRDDTGPEGPNWDKKSKEVDGDTSENAGIFK